MGTGILRRGCIDWHKVDVVSRCEIYEMIADIDRFDMQVAKRVARWRYPPPTLGDHDVVPFLHRDPSQFRRLASNRPSSFSEEEVSAYNRSIWDNLTR
jgi:hypothetical protein